MLNYQRVKTNGLRNPNGLETNDSKYAEPIPGFLFSGPLSKLSNSSSSGPTAPVLHGPISPILMISRVMRTCEAGTQQNLHPYPLVN